jgi:predicted Zn-dependent peptidase
LYDGYDFLARQRLDEAIEQVTAKQASDVVRNYLQKSPMVWSIGQGK